MRFLLPTALVIVLALGAHAGAAPTARAQAPELSYQFPAQDQVLAEPPVFLQMCFSRAVDVRDLDKGGDFSFDLIRPNGLGVGMRIVFQVDGYGVAIFPGQPGDDQINGPWRLEYTVRDRETLEELTGTLNFIVDPAGEPVPQETPPACSAGSTPGQPGATGTGAATATPSGGAVDEDDGTDVTLLVLLTLGIAIVAGLLALFAYLIRNRFGFKSRDSAPGDKPPDDSADH